MSIRTFVAIAITDEVRARLATLCKALAETRARVRWVRPDAMHLTLVFIGDVPDGMSPALSNAVQESVAGIGPFTLNVTGTGFFGKGKSPRVIWAGVQAEDAPLTDLQSRLATAMRALDLQIDDRPYSPHLTIGRVRGRTHVDPLLQALEAHAEEEFGEVPVNDVRLMRSELRRDGAVYHVLHQAPLSAEGESP